MDSPSKLESLAVRFAPYVGDLHEYFVRCGMPFGSSDDLAAFAAAIAMPGSFHDDLCSILRSIIYRENKTINMMELLQLLLVAVGGPHVNETAGDVHDPVRELLSFVREVYRSLQRAQPAEPTLLPLAEPDTLPRPRIRIYEEAEEQAVSTVPIDRHLSRLDDRLDDMKVLPVPPSPPAPLIALPADSNVFARARALAAELAELEDSEGDEDSEGAFLESASLPPEPPSSTETPDFSRAAWEPLPDPPYPVARPRSLAVPWNHNSRRWLWIPALAALVLVAVAGTLFRHRSERGIAGTVPIATRRTPAVTSFPTPATNPSPWSEPSNDAPAEEAVAPTAGGGVDSPEERPYDAPAATAAHPASSSPERIAPLTGAKRAAVQPGGTQAPFASPEPLPKAIYPETANEAPRAVGPRSSRPERPVRAVPNSRSGAVVISSGVMAGNLIAAPQPDYPRLAKLTHVQGEVVLQAFVARDGSVIATHILRGPHMLRGAAEHAVRRWRYRPYLVAGRATDVATVVSVDFHLHP